MWKVFLAYGVHRMLLLVLALIAINSRISPDRPGYTFKKIQPVSILFDHFLQKIKENPEFAILDSAIAEPVSKVFERTSNPFVWLARVAYAFLPVQPVTCLLILSNIFCLLFLWEVYALVNRMALPEVASGAAVLSLLWITSYEMSMGSAFSLSCFLVLFSLRHAVDNIWILTGLGLALLGIFEPLMVGLLPLVLYIFVYYQRHFSLSQVAKRALFFLLPVAGTLIWRWEDYRGVLRVIQSSSFPTVWHAISTGNFFELASTSHFGQSFSLVFFLFGAIAAFATNTTVIHRILPLYSLLVVLAFSSYAQLASRVLFAAACMGGITAVGSTIVVRLCQLTLILLGGYEIVTLFQ
jgi:hypothetical protein